MRRMIHGILALFLLLISANAKAQNPPVEEFDSLTTSVQVYTDKEPASFSTITQINSVDTRKVSPEKVDALQKSDDYWYANLQPQKEPEARPRQKNLFDAQWFWSLLWIIVLCSFIAVVIWYLASSNIRLFRKTARPLAAETEEEAFADDIFSINYEREIKKAEDAANYRLAVRLWYLGTLKGLADRNIINYRAETPNGDYVNALYGGRYYQPFFRLTRSFEYTWYGQFNLTGEGYSRMRTEFLTFKNSLS